MPLSVLTDGQIRGLLENLTSDELESFRLTLRQALHDYSVGAQDRPIEDDTQPERQTVYCQATGTKTLFMPARAPVGLGVKVITLSSPQTSHPQDQAAAAAGARIDANGKGKGKESEAPPPPEPPVVRPTGGLTLFSPLGEPVAMLHASHLTAFRTALASLCLVERRQTVRVLTVFGAGLQAYWHVRLTLMARGSTIKQVNIINHRYSDSCRDLLRTFLGVPPDRKAAEGWQACQFEILTPTYVEYERLLREKVRAADVIFCCTPSTEELFPAGLLTSSEGRRKGRLLVAVGSYTPHMAEIPIELLHQAVRRHRGHGPHFHKHATEGGVVVVDTLDGALKEAGELIAAGLRPDQLVELGELVMLHEMNRRESEGDEQQQQQQQQDSGGGEGGGGGGSGGGGGGGGSNGSITLESPTATVSTADSDKLELTPGTPSMSSVFGSAGASRASSRGSSPSRWSSAALSLTASSTNDSGSSNNHHNRSSSIHKILPFLVKRPSSRGSSSETRKKKEDHMVLWLQTGNVIYKSVGLGLMDLTVGMHLVQLAKEKGVGTHVEEF